MNPKIVIRVIEQHHQVLSINAAPLELIEVAGRTCYKSEDKITLDSAGKFVEMVMKRGHESVIEHSSMTVKFITNRGVTHEWVRHRLCAFSQESTRYVNYGNKPITFIRPVWANGIALSDYGPGNYEELKNTVYSRKQMEKALPLVYVQKEAERLWLLNAFDCASTYTDLLDVGWRPEEARDVLPNSLKTELVVTANFREWRHVFNLRTSKAAHPQMRSLMNRCLWDIKKRVPVLFDDMAAHIE